MSALSDLAKALQSGEIEVIDLTSDLDANTPLLPLPPHWPNTPAFQLNAPLEIAGGSGSPVRVIALTSK